MPTSPIRIPDTLPPDNACNIATNAATGVPPVIEVSYSFLQPDLDKKIPPVKNPAAPTPRTRNTNPRS